MEKADFIFIVFSYSKSFFFYCRQDFSYLNMYFWLFCRSYLGSVFVVHEYLYKNDSFRVVRERRFD